MGSAALWGPMLVSASASSWQVIETTAELLWTLVFPSVKWGE